MTRRVTAVSRPPGAPARSRRSHQETTHEQQLNCAPPARPMGPCGDGGPRRGDRGDARRRLGAGHPTGGPRRPPSPTDRQLVDRRPRQPFRLSGRLTRARDGVRRLDEPALGWRRVRSGQLQRQLHHHGASSRDVQRRRQARCRSLPVRGMEPHVPAGAGAEVERQLHLPGPEPGAARAGDAGRQCAQLRRAGHRPSPRQLRTDARSEPPARQRFVPALGRRPLPVHPPRDPVRPRLRAALS